MWTLSFIQLVLCKLSYLANFRQYSVHINIKLTFICFYIWYGNEITLLNTRCVLIWFQKLLKLTDNKVQVSSKKSFNCTFHQFIIRNEMESSFCFCIHSIQFFFHFCLQKSTLPKSLLEITKHSPKKDHKFKWVQFKWWHFPEVKSYFQLRQI